MLSVVACHNDSVFAVPSRLYFPSGRPVVVTTLTRECSASGHDTLIANVRLTGKIKCVWMMWLGSGSCLGVWVRHSDMRRSFSLHNSRSLPALQCWCQAAARLMQVEGIVLYWMLSFNDLSSRNLAAIFRRAQLLLRTQQSFTRDLWNEPVRNSCSFLPLAGQKKGQAEPC